MVRALLPDTPRHPQIQPELPFLYFLQYFWFFQFFLGSLTWDQQMTHATQSHHSLLVAPAMAQRLLPHAPGRPCSTLEAEFPPPPPNPAVFGYLMLWRSLLLGVPMAWRRRQAMAKWRLGRIKWRWTWGDRCGGPRHFTGPQRHLALAWRQRQAVGKPSNWERPVTGNAITSIGNAITLNGNAITRID